MQGFERSIHSENRSNGFSERDIDLDFSFDLCFAPVTFLSAETHDYAAAIERAPPCSMSVHLGLRVRRTRAPSTAHRATVGVRCLSLFHNLSSHKSSVPIGTLDLDAMCVCLQQFA